MDLEKLVRVLKPLLEKIIEKKVRSIIREEIEYANKKILSEIKSTSKGFINERSDDIAIRQGTSLHNQVNGFFQDEEPERPVVRVTGNSMLDQLINSAKLKEDGISDIHIINDPTTKQKKQIITVDGMTSENIKKNPAVKKVFNQINKDYSKLMQDLNKIDGKK